MNLLVEAIFVGLSIQSLGLLFANIYRDGFCAMYECSISITFSSVFVLLVVYNEASVVTSSNLKDLPSQCSKMRIGVDRVCVRAFIGVSV